MSNVILFIHKQVGRFWMTLFLLLSEAHSIGLRGRPRPPEISTRWVTEHPVKNTIPHFDNQFCVCFFFVLIYNPLTSINVFKCVFNIVLFFFVWSFLCVASLGNKTLLLKKALMSTPPLSTPLVMHYTFTWAYQVNWVCCSSLGI